jgi:hypothetical protein
MLSFSKQVWGPLFQGEVIDMRDDIPMGILQHKGKKERVDPEAMRSSNLQGLFEAVREISRINVASILSKGDLNGEHR